MVETSSCKNNPALFFFQADFVSYYCTITLLLLTELASVPEELLMSGVQDGSPSVFAPPFPRLSNKSGLDDASVTTRKRSRLVSV